MNGIFLTILNKTLIPINFNAQLLIKNKQKINNFLLFSFKTRKKCGIGKILTILVIILLLAVIITLIVLSK